MKEIIFKLLEKKAEQNVMFRPFVSDDELSDLAEDIIDLYKNKLENKKEGKGKLKCESYFGDYKCHVKTNVKDSNGNFIYVDKCLKEAIENLNAKGFKTVASCCGHGVIQPRIDVEL